MVKYICEFIECWYIAHRNTITSSDLDEFDKHLKQFHQLWDIFIKTGVCTAISLPRQHSLMHYTSKIELFASPNGVCSSITVSTHITAVKKPWWCSNCNTPLLQMMQTISHLYKLNALHQVFENCGMLDGRLSDYANAFVSGNLPPVWPYGIPREQDDDDDDEIEAGQSSEMTANAQVTLAFTHGE